MSKDRAVPAVPRSGALKLPALKVDSEKFPNVAANPSLERALRIRQALQHGWPRDEAERLAALAMGPKGRPAKASRPKSTAKTRGKARR